jgi:hypothetical protein
MTEAELAAEIETVRELCRPLYLKMETYSDAELVGAGRAYAPCVDVRAIRAELKPMELLLEYLKAELTDRARQRANSALWDKKQAAIAAAPVYQRRNGWEIVRLDPTMPIYNVRDPATKEEVYTGSLRRCREVADDSKPEAASASMRK